MSRAVQRLSCEEVGELVVAFQDGELSLGEEAAVREHLEMCSRCAAWERRLSRATPRPTLLVPPRTQRRLARSVDDAVDREWERLSSELGQTGQPRGTSGTPSRQGWLAREHRVQNRWVVLYVAALVAATLFGVFEWWAGAPSRERVADAPASTPIPTDQYRPASYTP